MDFDDKRPDAAPDEEIVDDVAGLLVRKGVKYERKPYSPPENFTTNPSLFGRLWDAGASFPWPRVR